MLFIIVCKTTPHPQPLSDWRGALIHYVLTPSPIGEGRGEVKIKK